MFKFLREANYVEGEWIDSRTGGVIAVDNPATGAVLGTVPDCGVEETRAAIAAAHRALPAYAGLTALERANLLQRLSELVLTNLGELARLLTAEQGKPLAEAEAEVRQSAAYIRWFAEEARRVYGMTIPSPWPGRRITVTRQPVGVVGAITPWNFPSSMLARKLGPALAAGCTIVAKPAAQTPYSGLAWAVLAEMAGFPPGVVNIVTGSAAAIGGELTASPLVRKITFTGSTLVGKLLIRQSADTVKKMSMELGGNAPFLVFDDADLDQAIAGAMASKFRNAGQTCVCTNRIYVQREIYEVFVERLAEAAQALVIGDGMNAGTEIGPLIDERAVLSTEAFVADALAKGGRLLSGGARHPTGPRYFAPTVIADANGDMLCAREEIFGPLAPVFVFDNEEEAIALANDTEFGLACYFYTRDLGRAFRVSERLDYGIVGVNEGLVTTEVAPFGGFKQSGLGREGGPQGIEDYLETKYTCFGGLGAA